MSHSLPEDDLDEMLPEYDFTGGVRGKYAGAFQQGYQVVIHHSDGSREERDYPPLEGLIKLDPDVKEYFPDAKSVNDALRGLIDLIPDYSAHGKVGH